MRINRCIRYVLVLIAAMLFFKYNSVKAEENVITYDGELGYFYTQTQTTFKFYSSSATDVKVVVEGINNDRCPNGVCPLTKDSTNVWVGYAPGNLLNKEYTYIVEQENDIIYENVLDPYTKYINQTGDKSVIYDDGIVTFEDWDNQIIPLSIKDKNKIIYGINVNGFTNHVTWTGSNNNKGKLLGLIEENTKYNNYLTGYDYIKSLGITYIELSRIYDVNNPFSIDESIVAGSDYHSGSLEMKHVVNNYYSNNIGVIIEFDYKDFSQKFLNNLKKIDKDIYLNEENLNLSNPMVKNYIKDLLVYLVSNYKLAGLKIENMGDYELSFINNVTSKLKEINENIIIYGDGSYENLDETKAGENNLNKLNDIKMLNGSLNYALFGNLKNNNEIGILDGNYEQKIIETLKFTLLSSVDNGEIDYSLVNGVSYKQYWGNSTSYQIVNYMGEKDGLSIYDKLIINNISGQNIIRQKAVLAFGTMMFSGGIPYIYSGNEFLVSYLDINNEQNSVCDENANFCFHKDEKYKTIDWSYAQSNSSTIDAFKALVNYRKSSKTVAQTDAKAIEENVEFYIDDQLQGVLGFTRNYKATYNGDTEKLFVVINYSNQDYTLENMESKGWRGLYTHNNALRDGTNIILKSNSIYSEIKEVQPKFNQWITLIMVVGIIGLIYYFNILLNKRLVEKKGYDITEVKKKYRPFINRNKKDDNADNEIENNENEEGETLSQEDNEE